MNWKGIWGIWMWLTHIAVELFVILMVCSLLIELTDSVIFGALAAIAVWATPLSIVTFPFVVALKFLFVGIPNIIFMKFGWITEEDL